MTELGGELGGTSKQPASRTHAAANTVLAVLAALTATASALAHHYDVVVRPEVCPAVRNVPTTATQSPGGRSGDTAQAASIRLP